MLARTAALMNMDLTAFILSKNAARSARRHRKRRASGAF